MTLDSSEEDVVNGALHDILVQSSDYLDGEVHIETSFRTSTLDDG